MFDIGSRIKSYIREAVAEALPRPAEQPRHAVVDILLAKHGYESTVQSKLPVAADGSPIPWYTYPAVEYFNQLDAKDLRIFEYGCGNSSMYWSSKGALVWSVEHDASWHERMNARSAKLQGLYLAQSAAEYASAIDRVDGQFDIVIIDGVWRNECAMAALPRLRAGGIIILDNSDWYTDVAALIRARGFFQVDFNGFGPINNYCWTTSILLPCTSDLGGRLGQPRPIGGIEVTKGDKW